MHVCPHRPEPFEITVERQLYRVRKDRWPQYGRWQIIAERILADGRAGGYHLLADARDEADLEELSQAGWVMDRRQSGWPIGCAIVALGPK